MTRENLAEVLEEIALLLELKNENPFKIRAYRQGADTVRNFDGDIVQLAIDSELKGIKGIGDALRDKLHELASTGTLRFHQDLRAGFPAGLFELFDLQGLGPKKVKVLHETLGVGSIADLKAACEDGRVAALPGFGAKTQTKILEAIALRETFAGRFLLGDVTPAGLRDPRHPPPSPGDLAASPWPDLSAVPRKPCTTWISSSPPRNPRSSARTSPPCRKSSPSSPAAKPKPPFA